MTGMRIRDIMLAAGVMAMVVATITLQLSMASQMIKLDGDVTAAVVAASE